MSRARSPDSIEAEKMYHEGMKLVDIARKIGVPDSTVRRWKSTQKWEGNNYEQDKKERERSHKKKANARKAKGAPKGNTNALKHGVFSQSSVLNDVFDEDEIMLVQEIPNDEAALLKWQIARYMLREEKLKKKIKELEEKSKKGLYVKGVKKNSRLEFDENGEQCRKIEETSTDTEYSVRALVALESELTKIQRAQTKSIDSLIRLRAIDERYDDLINGWKSKAESMASSTSNAGESEKLEDVIIYLPDNGRD